MYPRESFSKIVVNSYDFLEKLDKVVAEIKMIFNFRT